MGNLPEHKGLGSVAVSHETEAYPLTGKINHAKSADSSINFFGLRLHLSHILLVISMILFLPNVAPLFDPGPPINSDIGVHYSAIACLDKQDEWSLTTAWCAHGQAGLPRLQRYAIVHAFFTRFLEWFMPLETAFKITMVFGFLVLPFSGYALLRWISYPLAGSIAFAMLLLEPGGYLWGGYTIHFLSGSPTSITANGFSLLTIFVFMWMLTTPNRARIFIASLTASVTFLSHPAQALWLPIAIIPLGWLYRREILLHWRELTAFPFLSAAMISFWLLPALHVSSNFNQPGVSGNFFTLGAIQGFISNLYLVQHSLIMLGILASLYLLTRSERELRFIGSIGLLIPTVWIFGLIFPSFPYFHYFTIDRSGYELRTFLILSLALVMGGCKPECLFQFGKASKRGLILLAILFLISFWAAERILASTIITYTDIEPAVAPSYRFFQNATGRIIAESTYFHMDGPLGQTHPWTLAGALSDKEFLGNGDFWYTSPDFTLANNGILFQTYVWNMSDQELLDIFDLLNVQYVWTFTPNFGDLNGRFAAFLPNVTSFPLPNEKTAFVYEVLGNHSFFKFPAGNIESYTYNTTRATAIVESSAGGALLFKVRYWQNWRATVNGKEIPIRRGALGLMEIDIPPGRQAVHFKYGMRLIDWAGYLLSFVGLLLGVLWVARSPK